MTGALLLGVLAGVGMIAAAAGLAPRRVSLAQELQAIIGEPAQPPFVTAQEDSWAARVRPARRRTARLHGAARPQRAPRPGADGPSG